MTYYVYNYTSLSDRLPCTDYTDLKILNEYVKDFIRIYGSLTNDYFFTDVFTLVQTFETEEEAFAYIMSIPMKHKYVMNDCVRFDGILTE